MVRVAFVGSVAAVCAACGVARGQIAGFQGTGAITYTTFMPGGGATTGPIAFDPFWYNPFPPLVTNYIWLTQSRAAGPASEFASTAMAGTVLYNAPTNTAAAAFAFPNNTSLVQRDPGGNFGAATLRADFVVDMLVGGAGLNVTSSGLSFLINSRRGALGFGEIDFRIDYLAYNTVTGASVALGAQAFQFISPVGVHTQFINLPAGFLGSTNIPFVAGGIGGASQWVFRSVGAIQWTVNNDDEESSINMIPAPGAMALIGFGGLISARRRR